MTDAVTQSKGDCEKTKSDDEIVDCKPPEPYDSAALFFYKDRFYEVSAFLQGPAVGASDSFLLVERSLTRALGGPYRDRRRCQNGFGAIFMNHLDVWDAGKVTVTLDDRGCHPALNNDGIFAGYMEITYEPFAPPEKPKSPVEAPF